MNSSGSNSSGGGEMIKMERKTIEKQRRMQMKGLCLHLASLIPTNSISNTNINTRTKTKDESTQLDSLEEAAAYIVKLRNIIEQLKQMREKKIDSDATCSTSTTQQQQHTNNSKMPIIQVRYQNPTLEVVLVLWSNNSNTNTSTTNTCSFHKVIRIIEEEGADVVNGSQCRLGDKIVYTIHSQLRNRTKSPFRASALSNTLKHCLTH